MKRILLVLIVIMGVSCQRETKPMAKDFSHLVPFRIGSHWGFSDTAKNLIIPVKYDDVEIINDSTARVKYQHHTMFINVQEKEIFPFPYFDFDGFSEGMGIVSQMRLYGFIDTKGKEIVAPKYDAVEPFFHGLSKVKLDDKYGFINKEGKEVIPVIHSYIDNYAEGTYKAIANTKIAVYDTLGNVIIPFQSGAVDIFSDGLIEIYTSQGHCFKNKKGETQFCSPYRECSRFKQGRAYAGNNEHYGIMDKKGKMITPPIFEMVEFGDGDLIAVELQGLAGYLDSLGNPVIPLRYEYADQFRNGFAAVGRDDKVALINKEGKVLTPFIYDDLKAYPQGVIIYQKGIKNNFGLMDTAGHELTDAIYHSINTTGFINKMMFGSSLEDLMKPIDPFIVEKNGKYGFVNLRGKEIGSLKYDQVRPFSEGLAAVSLSNKWGYINEKGEEVIPLKYLTVNNFKGGLARVGTSDFGYINKRGIEFFDEDEQPPSQ